MHQSVKLLSYNTLKSGQQSGVNFTNFIFLFFSFWWGWSEDIQYKKKRRTIVFQTTFYKSRPL
uniref:Putative ovule protein n=1 Tax=Solanum chacoense TaxID=4108 RepID=A0A0V0GGZ8_SOLCH